MKTTYGNEVKSLHEVNKSNVQIGLPYSPHSFCSCQTSEARWRLWIDVFSQGLQSHQDNVWKLTFLLNSEGKCYSCNCSDLASLYLYYIHYYNLIAHVLLVPCGEQWQRRTYRFCNSAGFPRLIISGDTASFLEAFPYIGEQVNGFDEFFLCWFKVQLLIGVQCLILV